MGLHRAGFDVTGVDIKPQKHYPFRFIQGDALRPPVRLEDFDLVWASPPCQAYTTMDNRRRSSKYAVIPNVRELLRGSKLSVIENVMGARREMPNAIRLTGEMFALRVHRPRLFELSGFWMMAPSMKPRQKDSVAVYGKPDGRRLWDRADGTMLRAWRLEDGKDAMGIDWADAHGIKEAIPPAYAEHIGNYAMMALDEE